MQISQKDLQILDTLGRGASSVVCKIMTCGPACLVTECSDTQTDGVMTRMQVMKAFYLKGNTFVAIKRISVFEKVPLQMHFFCCSWLTVGSVSDTHCGTKIWYPVM